MKKEPIFALRGMKDTIDEAKKFSYFIGIASDLAQKFGFSLIQTPILEQTSLFMRSVGASSDIVNKEMYRFVDKGDNDVCLRPEGTAGVVRAFIEKKLDRQDKTQRFFYYGPMFRYERPQKGRFRQFYQFGVETFGEASAYETASLIMLAKNIFELLGISFEIEINSIGCKTCVKAYKQKLQTFLSSIDLCDDCKTRKEHNPLRVFDCKNASCIQNYTHAPKITDNLCDECQNDFDLVLDLLNGLNIEYAINKNLVRGLDYYTKTAFEFTSNALGAQNAIAGGGRYDALVEALGGKPTCAVGFAIGIERILDLMTLRHDELSANYIGVLDERLIKDAFLLSSKYRKSHKIHCETKARTLKNHLKHASKMGVKKIFIIGENEDKNETIWLKDLHEQREKIISQKDLERELD